MTQYVRRQGIEGASREERAKAKRHQERYPAQLAFLKRYLPGIASLVETCGAREEVYASTVEEDYYRVTASKCRQVPWCIRCTSAEEWTRVHKYREVFRACTPRKGKLRLMHIVQTAPYGADGQYVDGGDWGKLACKDVETFKEVVWKSLQEWYPGDIGAIFSYQDFGERPFLKRHPHIDLTLNGWMLDGDTPERTPYYDVTRGGYERAQDIVVKHAREAWPEIQAERGTFHIGKPAIGPKIQAHVLKYQLREMVNLRNLWYEPGKTDSMWWNYSERSWMKIANLDFLAGVEEYRWRLKQWPEKGENGMNLHTRHGHMDGRRMRSTRKRMHSTEEHGKRCKCKDCHQWRRVFYQGWHVPRTTR